MQITNPENLKEVINKLGYALYAPIKGSTIQNLWDLTENPSWDKTLGPWLDEVILSGDFFYPFMIKNNAGIVSLSLLKVAKNTREFIREMNWLRF